MKKRKVNYFGYGANAHKEMMKALIGREPEGYRCVLKEYGLFLQSWSEIPRKAREILKKSWNKDFSSYIVVPCKGVLTWGKVWKLTREERKIVGEWEIHNIWYTPIKVHVYNEKGKKVAAETEIIPIFKTTQKAIQTKRYKNFLNKKKKMLKLARDVRKRYLTQ